MPMLLPLTSAAVLAVGGTGGLQAPPVVCVDTSGVAVGADAVVRALRPRVRRVVRVAACRDVPTPTWRVSVRQVPPGELRLKITGRGLDSTSVLAARELGPEELAQLVALTAAEAMRPAIVAWVEPEAADLDTAEPFEQALAALDVCPEPPPCPDPAGCPEPPPCPDPAGCPEPAACPEVRASPTPPAVPSVALSAGMRFGAEERALSAFAALRGAMVHGPLRVALIVGGAASPRQRVGSGELTGFDLWIAAGPGWQSGWLALGVSLVARSARMTLKEPAESHTASFWGVGLLADATFVVWETTRWRVGLELAALVWPQPDRLTVRGVAVHTRSYLELTLGPSITLLLP